jgi:hypothetical protein
MMRRLRVRDRAFRPPDHGIRAALQIMVLTTLQIMVLVAVPPAARLPVLFRAPALAPKPARRAGPCAGPRMADGEGRLPVVLRRLARLQAVAESSGAAEDALRAAVAGISLDDFGAPATGWARCYRTTRIVLKVAPAFMLKPLDRPFCLTMLPCCGAGK